MRYKKKLIGVVVLMMVLSLIKYVLPAHSKVVTLYNEYVFHPFQSVRNIIFSIVPFSVGDFLYILGTAGLVVLAVRWIMFLRRFGKYKHQLGASLLHTIMIAGMVYVLFILGWGGNYYKPSLTSFWNLDKSGWSRDTTLEQFDAYLIDKLNEYAPGYKPLAFSELDDKAKVYYKELTDSRNRTYGVKVKPSFFGNLMQHFSIQGYYNPFTGEAQVNRHLPAFMLPFVMCHEMAHQSGIAAEDDANLLSYAVSTLAPDSTFRYSAYFNLWLYTHARLKRSDSSAAKMLLTKLNGVTKSHLAVLKELRRKYASGVSDYSGALYDGYLKLHHQKDGIESYNKVAITAWAWENKLKEKGFVIQIP